MIVRPLRALLAFHRRGTIMAAAEDVHLSPGAVSVQLKLLEERLGVPLFERTRRSMRLTPAGHKVIPLAEKVLAAYEELLQSSGATIHGQMSLGIINSVLLGTFPAAIQQVIADSPGIEIRISSGTASELVAKVNAGLLDAVIVTQPPKPLGDELISHALYAEPIALVQPAARAQKTVAAALAVQPYIALDRTTWAGQVIQTYLPRHAIAVEPVMELNSPEVILASVRFGLGASILPVIRGVDTRSDTFFRFKKNTGFKTHHRHGRAQNPYALASDGASARQPAQRRPGRRR